MRPFFKLCILQLSFKLCTTRAERIELVHKCAILRGKSATIWWAQALVDICKKLIHLRAQGEEKKESENERKKERRKERKKHLRRKYTHKKSSPSFVLEVVFMLQVDREMRCTGVVIVNRPICRVASDHAGLRPSGWATNCQCLIGFHRTARWRRKLQHRTVWSAADVARWRS